ncbi:protein S100-A10-like [Boleophthalmus pectinirostris]|uniref:protein S100-A10-like n=1 Tax=Boleophthalmus pectinirostris TaxID=150288 RepID=UPI00242C1BCF|nr:protein S100-A10-like [Boleophthalmus pectinirostris]
MSALQGAMAALIGVFHEHAGGNRTLDKKELAALLKKEFEGLASNNPESSGSDFHWSGPGRQRICGLHRVRDHGGRSHRSYQ